MSFEPSPILIVDDEPLNRDILVDVLEEDGYALHTATSGAEALAALSAPQARYDAVLLDRMMPGMDGLEVLRRIKADPALRSLPVIMQTAAASKTQVVEGIEAGAFYYLTKPFELEVVRSLVRAAVESAHAQRALLAELERNRSLVGLMERAAFSVRTPDEARRLSALLAGAAPQPQSAVLGLAELLLNAIEHGNLGLSYADKSRLKADGAWEAEVARRLASREYAARTVSIEWRRTGSTAEVLITDQGGGFDWQPYMQIDAARAFDSHGRGIALARLMSFDQVEYLGCGNQVRARFADADTAASASAATSA
jgi:CheY-like chemotaxis protein